MRILILGGTVFLGRHLTEAFLSRGHEVTHYNRGLSNTQLFPEVEKLRGDRNFNLLPLRGRSWDAVVDTCGYFPRQAVATAKALYPDTPLYAFISSVNQYADLRVSGVGEDYPSASASFQATQSDPPLTPETYGPLKAACEKVVQEIYGDRALIVRPGCLVGPYDQAHRFSYWVRRAAAGGPMLVPGSPDQVWQIIDVRDAAEWIVRMLEERRTGTFNIVGPEQPISASRLVQQLALTAGIDAQPVWLDTEFLRTSSAGTRWLDLAEWSDLSPAMAHLYSIDNARAVVTGLCFRPLAVTARNVLDWLALRAPQEPDALDPDRENRLLCAWKRYVMTVTR
ncbi:MAG TPA: NAD-dependent epimerase/dehydratase family protein [Nitrospira sp.]|nr:NAD-dependent epimerase/dehydratase family protein [Nitrospira sp.]